MFADSATRRRIIETVLARVDEAYVHPDVATEMDQAVRRRVDRGEYDDLDDLRDLATALTKHLREASGDLHIRVAARQSPVPAYPSDGATPPELLQERAARGRRSNFGLTKVEVLNGNIGLLCVNSFDFEPEPASATVAAALTFLSHTQSLIIDLRANHGGEPAMVQLLASYFFHAPPVQLSSIFWRQRNVQQEFWTHADVEGPRYGAEKKVRLLTSRETFSAAEQFCYDLKQLGRATLIGERTGGAAHPVWPYRIDQHVELLLPTGRAINPISKTNWEQQGIRPTREVTAEQALDVALLAARSEPHNGLNPQVP